MSQGFDPEATQVVLSNDCEVGFVRVGEKEQVIFLELRAAELGFPDVGVGDDSPAGTRVLVFNVPVSAALAPGHASTPAALA